MSLTVKQANDQLRKWRACSEGFDRVRGKRSIKSMVEAASLSDLVWAIERVGGAALAEYERVRVAASAKYDRVCGADYRVRDPALAEYNRVCGADYRVRDPALAEYNRVRGAASAEYERVRVAASAEYGRACETAARSILLKKFGGNR